MHVLCPAGLGVSDGLSGRDGMLCRDGMFDRMSWLDGTSRRPTSYVWSMKMPMFKGWPCAHPDMSLETEGTWKTEGTLKTEALTWIRAM